MALNVSPTSIPLKLGDPQAFSTARQFFARVGFDQATLCRTLALDDMSDLGKVDWEKLDKAKFSPELWTCLEVFVRGTALPQELVAFWGTEVLDALRSLGLLRDSRKNPGAIFCPVWLYPVDTFLVASDRRTDPEADAITPSEDVVFPGIYAGTLRFLKLLPDARGGDALDLCGGSGIGALELAASARRSVTADLTERSAFFADFNGRLSGVAMESLCGDLYHPVKGQQFDLITAHPPFVPSTGKTMIYRDAGAAGEDVTHGIITGLAEHLRPGGTCVVLCVACDTFEAPFEQRVAQWIGEKRAEFDILYGLEKVLTVEGVVASMAQRGQTLSSAEAENLLQRLKSLGTRQFVYGALFIRRLKGATALPPLRFKISPSATAAEFERLFAWRQWYAAPGVEKRFAGATLKLRPDVQLTVRHLVDEGELTPAEFVFSIENGLRAAFRPDAWVVPLLAQFNGKRSVQEVFNQFESAGELPKDFRLNDFASLLKRMIESGFFDLATAGSSHQQA